MSAGMCPSGRRVIGMLFALLLAFGSLQLAGCASYAQPRPFTTEAEARAELGEPTRRWANDDGTTTLEYATQPEGDSCLMVQVDQGGIVLRQWDALAEDNLARVRKGMTQDEVSRLLGEHRSEQRFRASGEVVWDWNIRNYGPGIATLFNVHFVDGKVVRTSQTYVDPRDYGMYGVWGGYPYWHYPYSRAWPRSFHPRYRAFPHPWYYYW